MVGNDLILLLLLFTCGSTFLVNDECCCQRAAPYLIRVAGHLKAGRFLKID
uniref:Uncharacterized protein n=2 Tax=Cercopithecinae TaxID=9528 RepID=A0A8D2JYK2_THEGE|nr:unnamed protein product [Macaca fascicularis]